MQFQVPQFIETEDKIVGPLTIKQFIYVAIGGGLSAILYFTVNFTAWIIASIFLLAASAALGFLKISGRPLSKVILSAIHFYWKPQLYVWQPENPKTLKEEQVQSLESSRFSVEDIVSGAALKSVWRNLQTGSRASPHQFEQAMRRDERYQIFRKGSGDRQAARRVDFK